MPFCPHCGKEVGEEDSYCRSCGKTLLRSPVQKPIPQAPSLPEVDQVQSTLSKHIREDEKALWIGKPEKTPFIIPSLAAIPFGLIFLGFSLFWMWGVGSSGAPWPFTLFGLPFVLIGFGITFGGSISQYLRYNNTEYMITDQRMIIQTGVIGLNTRFVDLNKIQEVYVKVGFIDRKFGTGTVYASTAGYGTFMSFPPTAYAGAFSALKNPYEVQRILQEALRNVRKTDTA